MKLQIPTNLDTEQLATLLQVGESLGLTLTRAPQQLTPIGFKIVKGVITCTLCNTLTTQYIKVNHYSNGSWLREKDLSLEETEQLLKDNSKLELYRAKVKSCWNCFTVLMEKDKKDLAEMVLKYFAPIPTKEEIWKYVRELKSTPIKELHP